VDTATFSISATAVSASLTTNVATGEGSDSFSAVENLIGSPLADALVGSAGVNRIDGVAGNDAIVAGAGNDTLIGGANTDSCNGGTGTDVASTCETLVAVP
jgi:Ca2+-binding RTX toxin-like protein